MSMAATGLAQGKAFVPDWVKDAVFYQIFPERFANGDTTNDPLGIEAWGREPKRGNYFGGDLQGIIDHLDYISSLGVNALYLNPIFESNTNHKYHTKEYLKIDPHFGDEKTFQRLVDECHARGIRIILDGVFNHTGVDFFAFEDIKKNGEKSKYVRWYNIYSFPVSPVDKPNYECWWGYGSLPKLMTHNPEVREYLFSVTRHWLNLGIDGWRLDVPNEIPHDFWIEWRKLVKGINPDAYIVGEIWDDATSWLGGDQFDAVMNYRFRRSCLDFFADDKSSVTAFDSALSRQRSDYPPDVNFVLQNLLGSHDTERILTLCKGNVEVLKLAVLFQMTYVGAPMVYYGDEIGMTGGKDPACRGTMVWNRSGQNTDLLQTYRQCIALRNAHPSLRRGSFETLVKDNSAGLYAFSRGSTGEHAIVLLNNGSATKSVDIPLSKKDAERDWKQIYPGAPTSVRTNGGTITVTIPAKSGLVFIGGA